MIKVIFFDVGGVYVKGSLASIIDNISNHLGISGEEVKKSIEKGFFFDFMKGRVGKEYFCAVVAKKLGTDPNTLKRLWAGAKELFDVNRDVEDIIIKLKEKGYHVGAITDTDPILVKTSLKKGIYSIFDFVVNSVEAKATKLDKEIYFKALEISKADPHECVIIDDTGEKLLIAKEVGMKAILFEGAEKLKKDLESLGVKI